MGHRRKRESKRKKSMVASARRIRKKLAEIRRNPVIPIPAVVEEVESDTIEIKCLREEEIVHEVDTCTNVNDLCWKEGAEDQFRGKYGTGGSRMAVWREKKEKKIRQAIAATQGFDFKTWSRVDVVVIDDEEEKVADELSVRLAELAKVIVTSNNKKLIRREVKIGLSRYDFVRHQAVFRYLKLRQKGVKKMKASQMCSEAFFSRSTINGHVCRSIRAWGDEWLLNGTLPRSKQGCHQKTPLLIEDEDVRDRCLVYLRTKVKTKRGISVHHFNSWIEKELLPVLDAKKKKTVCLRTVYYWLQRLGFNAKKYQKGIYYDGHERKDVVAYRNNIFLPRMAEYEKHFIKYSGENMEVAVYPELPEGEKVHVLVVHDESVFHSYDGGKIVWVEDKDMGIRRDSRSGVY